MDRRILDNVIWKTFCNVYTDSQSEQVALRQVIGAVSSYAIKGDSRYFSNYNNERKMLEDGITREDLAHFMAEFLAKCAKTKNARNDVEKMLYFRSR